jgi:hypothetical protein
MFGRGHPGECKGCVYGCSTASHITYPPWGSMVSHPESYPKRGVRNGVAMASSSWFVAPAQLLVGRLHTT